MRVVVPYTDLKTETIGALNATGRPWEPVWVGDSDEDYWSLLAGLWADGESFCIVEHDVVVEPDVFVELEACPSDWCGFPVPYFRGSYAGLACAKFGDELIARNPRAVVRAGEMSNARHPRKHWCTLDHFLQREVLAQRNEVRCIHPRVLGHIRDGDVYRPSHDCHD